MMTARNFPGDQYLSEAAARELVLRGTNQVGNGVQFRHDPRLQWPSLQYFSQEQSLAVLQDIARPTCLLLGDDGWPFQEDLLETMLKALEPSVYEKLPGSHHFHADPATADEVIKHVVQFLET
jgi:hypothetical protein